MVPPPHGWIKLNFDVVITPHASFISVVGRDPNVQIISVYTTKDPPQSLAWGEAKAILLAISTALNLGCKFVIYKGQRLSLILLLAHRLIPLGKFCPSSLIFTA